MHICIIFLLDIISLMPYVMFPFVSVIIVWMMVQDTFRHDKTRNQHLRENVVKLTLPCGRFTDPHSETSNVTSFVKVNCNTYHENDLHFWYIFITSFYIYLSFIVAQFEALKRSNFIFVNKNQYFLLQYRILYRLWRLKQMYLLQNTCAPQVYFI